MFPICTFRFTLLIYINRLSKKIEFKENKLFSIKNVCFIGCKLEVLYILMSFFKSIERVFGTISERLLSRKALGRNAMALAKA